MGALVMGFMARREAAGGVTAKDRQVQVNSALSGNAFTFVAAAMDRN